LSFEFFMADLKGLVADFRIQTLGPFLFWGLWLCALLASLRGVDRRDEIAQVTYMGALMALGVMLILVLPIGIKSQYGPVGRVIVFSVLLLIPSLRWMYVKKRTAFDVALQGSMQRKKKDSV
jgi:hypothetical protein